MAVLRDETAPVFPLLDSDMWSFGLTTRQLYAIAAMHAVASHSHGSGPLIATRAFEIADAMVREEAK